MPDASPENESRANPYDFFPTTERQKKRTVIRDRIVERLPGHLASRDRISFYAGLLADAWEECCEISEAIEKFSESGEESHGLMEAIKTFESLKVDIALYEKIAKLAYLWSTGFLWRSKHSEMASIKEELSSWWSDDELLTEMASDILQLRRKTEDLGVALSQRYLLVSTGRRRRKAAQARLRKIVGEVETISGRVRANLDERIA